jgi:hypothetical protein
VTINTSARAAEAAFLIDNRLLAECLDAIVSDAIEWMIAAPVSDDEARRSAACQAKAARAVRERLMSMISDARDDRRVTVA